MRCNQNYPELKQHTGNFKSRSIVLRGVEGRYEVRPSPKSEIQKRMLLCKGFRAETQLGFETVNDNLASITCPSS